MSPGIRCHPANEYHPVTRCHPEQGVAGAESKDPAFFWSHATASALSQNRISAGKQSSIIPWGGTREGCCWPVLLVARWESLAKRRNRKVLRLGVSAALRRLAQDDTSWGRVVFSAFNLNASICNLPSAIFNLNPSPGARANPLRRSACRAGAGPSPASASAAGNGGCGRGTRG